MRQLAFPSASRPSPSGAGRRGSGADLLRTVNQRLAQAERELRIQFTRIAQLQAQLDVVLGAADARRLDFTRDDVSRDPRSRQTASPSREKSS